MSEQPQTTKAPSVVLRLSRSTIAWFFLLLVIAGAVLTQIDPLQWLPYASTHPFQQIQRCATSKVQRLVTDTSTPDVLLVGSSLPMCAIYYWDMASFPKEFEQQKLAADKINLNILQSYNRAFYLTSEVSKRVGNTIDVYNLTVAASMVSDVDLLISKIIDGRKIPKVIVYGTFPRDFSDNEMPPLGETPTYKAVGDWKNILPPSSGMSTDAQQNLAIYSMYAFFRIKDNFRTWLTDVTAAKLNHPRSMADALVSTPPVVNAVPGTKQSSSSIATKNDRLLAEQDAMAKDYHNRYYPENKRRFEQEMDRFRHLIQLCKQHQITLVVINMPLSSKGRAVTTDDLYNNYLDRVSAEAKSNNVCFVDLESPGDYPDEDFIDIMHLNRDGGHKFQDRLAEILAKQLRP